MVLGGVAVLMCLVGIALLTPGGCSILDPPTSSFGEPRS